MRSTRILGIQFLDGDVAEAVSLISDGGGVMVVPAAPALVRLQHDRIYREAITRADAAIPDSGLMVLVWMLVRGRKIRRISGLAYIQRLIEEPAFHVSGQSLFVLPSEQAKTKLLGWARLDGRAINSDECYVAPRYDLAVQDRELLDLVRARQPAHIVVAIGNGPQEKLGIHLRDNLPYRPAIHCIGAALGFLTGDQVSIPPWADRFYLGWVLRLFAQPRIFIPRLSRSAILPWLMVRYGSELPALKENLDAHSKEQSAKP